MGTLAAHGLEVVVGVAVHFESVVRDDAKVAGATAEDCVEEVRVGAGVDDP